MGRCRNFKQYKGENSYRYYDEANILRIKQIIVAIKSQENLENSLNEEYGFRHFGFNNPYPSEGNPVYGYEMWVVIPEDFQVVEPFTRKEFMGGMFAAVPAYLTNIGERWNELWDWVNNNEKYEIDWNPEVDRRWFEECIDYMQFNAIETKAGDKQLDLLSPIRKKI